MAHASNILCARANIDQLFPHKIFACAKFCTRICAKKLTFDPPKENIHFFENSNADIFGARTRKFLKIKICDILILNFVIFKNFGLSVSRNRKIILKDGKMLKNGIFSG